MVADIEQSYDKRKLHPETARYVILSLRLFLCSSLVIKARDFEELFRKVSGLRDWR